MNRPTVWLGRHDFWKQRLMYVVAFEQYYLKQSELKVWIMLNYQLS